MKLTALFLLSAALCASAAGHSQKITLREKNAPLEKVFRSIHKQTGFQFIYNDEAMRQVPPVTIDVKDATLEDVLMLCFKGLPLSYHIEENSIVVKTDVNVVFQYEKVPPPIDVKGRVVNENGEPVLASIIVKGTQNGTTTDKNGYFILNDVDENAILIITGVSIEQPIEIKVNSKSNIGDIVTQTKVTEGQDVVVKTNYWETKQRLNPGNISKVVSKDIEKSPVSNPLATLQGRVTGLEIVQQTGLPGGNFTVRIRGQNSIINGNDPLFVIDGVPYFSNTLSFAQTSGQIYLSGSSPLNSINPSDIESIEVLKDADATAIYGSRGANGVVLITTKRGRGGRTKVDLNFYAGVGKVPNKMNLMNTRQYLDMRYEAFKNDGINWTNSSVIANDLKLWDTTRYTDWQKELIGGTANFLDGQITISGGEKRTQFSFGAAFHKETSVFPGNNDDNRIATHFNFYNLSLNQKLKTTFSIHYSENKTSLPRVDLTRTALWLAPHAPALYDSNGNLNWGANAWNGTQSSINPLSYTKTVFESANSTLIGNATVSYSVFPDLVLKANMGMTNTLMDAITTSPRSAFDPAMSAVIQNSSTFADNRIKNWIIEPQVSWNKKLTKGQIALVVGGSFLEQVNEGKVQDGKGFSSEALMKNINAADNISRSASVYTQYRYNSLFGRVNYNLKERYILNLTMRRDGSSRFGPGNQFANFGAVGAAWIFSEEKFMAKAYPFLSFGKLRLSYGMTGNDQIGDYQYLDTYSPSGSGVYMGTTGLNPQRLHNPDFAWESVRKLEVGLELGLLKNKFTAIVSYYRNRSANQLVGTPLPPTTGFTSIQSNLDAVVQNTGLEIEINSLNIEKPNFSWNTSFNVSIPRNKLLEFPNLAASQYVQLYKIGEPLNISKLYEYAGVDPTTGVYLFTDLNNDGIYNVADRQRVQFNGRTMFGGLLNTLRFKALQLDLLFEFVNQMGTSEVLHSPVTPGSDQINTPIYLLDRWQKAGDNTNTQKFSTLSPAQIAYSMLQSSDRSFSDASFIRLKNISFSWDLPKTVVSKIQAEIMRVFIRGQNLLTITGYKGLDPESQFRALPPLSVLTGGIQLTF